MSPKIKMNQRTLTPYKLVVSLLKGLLSLVSLSPCVLFSEIDIQGHTNINIGSFLRLKYALILTATIILINAR